MCFRTPLIGIRVSEPAVTASGPAIAAGATAGATAGAAAQTSAAASDPAVVHVTGPITIDVSGDAGHCAYYYPATRKGVAYSVSSKDMTGTSSTGGWDLHIQDDNGSDLSVILNTDHGSWTTTTSVHGTIHADPSLHHADFDTDVVKVIGQQHAHLTGSIDCP